MTDTANLALPFIEGSQAQKHVTHNEALRILDAVIQIGVIGKTSTAPPLTPADGERHVVPLGATGAWAGQTNAIASWEDGAWRFLVPRPGWLVWSAADNGLFVFNGTSWNASGGGGSPTLDNLAHLGINSTATAPNLLSVRSNAALFSAIGIADSGTGDTRIQISKESSANTASLVFSNAFSGRAEFGLVGSDDFKLKVSGDGTAFVEAFTIDRTSGNLKLPRGLALAGVIAPAQITANQNDYNPAGIASAAMLQISSDAARTISGLAGGGEGRIVCVLNVGGQTVTLADESVLSLAANRFTLGANLVLAPKQAAILRYDGTAARWFAIARPSAGGGLSIGTSADLAAAISDETGSGALVFASSPALAGTPLAPTAAVDTNTSQIATTAFVLGQASASGDGMPAASGTASRGTSTHYARADHVHPIDTTRAPASNIALSALSAQANNTFIGNVSGAAAPPAALTAAQVTMALSTMVGDTGSGGTKGLVPAPGAGDSAAGKFLRADGTYAVPPVSGGGGGGGLLDADRQNLLLARIYQSKFHGGYRRFLNAFADGYKAGDGIDAVSSSNFILDTAGGSVYPSGTLTSITKLLLHGDGTNGGTVFTDSSLSPHTVSIHAGSGISTSTADKVFGTASLKFSGAGRLISSSTDFNMFGDFTIDFWFKLTASTTAQYFLDFSNINTRSDGILISVNNGAFILYNNNALITSSAVSLNTWYHAAITRSGSTTRLFLNGVLQGTTTTAISVNANRVVIGGDPYSPAYVTGFMDEIRIINGSAAWTANFTPPTAPYGTPDNMTLVTSPQTADATVGNGRVLIEYDNTANPTLNTDLTVEVTCNGTTWTAASLSGAGTGQAGRKVAETVDQACTPGTSFAARIKTLNNKNVPIYGTSLTVR